MKTLAIGWILAILVSVAGCQGDSIYDWRERYDQLSFNMPVSDILDVMGQPDLKMPTLWGERWFWLDPQADVKIMVCVTPEKLIEVPGLGVIPQVKIETGRMFLKQWLEEER